MKHNSLDSVEWFEACYKISGSGFSKIHFLKRYKDILGISSGAYNRMYNILRQGVIDHQNMLDNEE